MAWPFASTITSSAVTNHFLRDFVSRMCPATGERSADASPAARPLLACSAFSRSRITRSGLSSCIIDRDRALCYLLAFL
jgi:hypothetical protein